MERSGRRSASERVERNGRQGGRPPPRRRHGRSGITLLEVMVVLAIIGMMAAAVGVKVYDSMVRARVKTACALVRGVADAAIQVMIEDGACPKSVNELVALHYLRDNQVRDPWGTELGYRCPAEHDADPVDVWSAGPDKVAGTADDIASWERGSK